MLFQFEGAYAMLRDLEKTDTSITSSMYNAIIAGFLREVTRFVSSKKMFSSSILFEILVIMFIVNDTNFRCMIAFYCSPPIFFVRKNAFKCLPQILIVYVCVWLD